MTVILIAVLALVAAASWLLPVLDQPTVAFGVRVPVTHGGAPVITDERQRYRRRVAVGCAVAVVATVLLVATGWWWPAPVAMVVLLVVTARAYVLAHRNVAAAKRNEGWYHGLPQVTAVDTTLRTRPEPFPWRWTAPAVVIVMATAAVGVLLYPRLPAFSPVVVQILFTALLVVVTRAGFTARADLDPADPTGAGIRHRHFITGLARRLLVLAAFVDAALAVTAWWMWTDVAYGLALSVAVATIAAGVLPLVHYAVRVGPDGIRVPAGAPVTAGPSRRDDDAHWRLGLVYVNPNDPAVMVPQRVGVGWTLNLGRPLSWLALAALLAVPAGAAGLLILVPR